MSTLVIATDLEVHHNDYVVLDKATLSIDEHDRIGMVGRNGSGKSTFLETPRGRNCPGFRNGRSQARSGHWLSSPGFHARP